MFNFSILDKISINFEVIEDNAGGLHLFVFDCNWMPVIAFCNFEYYKGSLQEMLIELSEYEYAEDFAFHYKDDNGILNPTGLYNELRKDGSGNNVIIDSYGFYISEMGSAAKYEFDIENY